MPPTRLAWKRTPGDDTALPTQVSPGETLGRAPSKLTPRRVPHAAVR